MQDNECFLVFEAKIDRFMKGLRQSLSQAAGLHFSKVSTPQNLISFSAWDSDIVLQLRFVVVGLGDSKALGRLSWLDQQGHDHVCCYVNNDFQCVARKANGLWREQKRRVGELCLSRLEDIKATI